MSLSRRTAIAKSGGQKAHQLGKAHQFTTEEARFAGEKGGKAKKNNIT